jgi:N-acyl-D-amino-acid deacylase
MLNRLKAALADFFQQADLVLMDWDKLGYVIDFHKPNTPPTGFRYVFVNGVPALEEGELTYKLTGRVIRKPVK